MTTTHTPGLRIGDPEKALNRVRRKLISRKEDLTLWAAAPKMLKALLEFLRDTELGMDPIPILKLRITARAIIDEIDAEATDGEAN